MIKRASLLVAALTAMLPRMVFSQHQPIQITIDVREVTISPRAAGEPGDQTILPDGESLNLPFTQSFAQLLRAEFSVVPGVLHKQRITAGGSDLSLEIMLSPPSENSTTAKAKFFFHKQREIHTATNANAVYKISDPFTDEKTVVIPFTGSSVELGKRMERFGEEPPQTVVTTFIGLTVLPQPPDTQPE